MLHIVIHHRKTCAHHCHIDAHLHTLLQHRYTLLCHDVILRNIMITYICIS